MKGRFLEKDYVQHYLEQKNFHFYVIYFRDTFPKRQGLHFITNNIVTVKSLVLMRRSTTYFSLFCICL